MSDAKIPEDLQAGYSTLRGWKESQDVQKTASLATLMLIESGLLYIERIAQAEAALAAVTEDRDRWQQMHENALKEARLAEAELDQLRITLTTQLNEALAEARDLRSKYEAK